VALLNHDFYNRAKSLIPNNYFEGEGREIYKVIVALHDKFNSDLNVRDVKEYLFETTKITTAQKTIYGNIFDILEKVAVTNPEISLDILHKLYKKSIAYEIGEIVADIVNGVDRPLSEIEAVFARAKMDPTEPVGTVTNDIGELLKWNDPSRRYAYGIPSVQERLGGAGPGHLLGVFARPDTGKSSFVACLAAGYARDGHIVDYFGNEEPGQKLSLNLLRAATHLTDGDLWANYRKGIVSYEEWDAIKDKIRVHDVVGYSVEALNDYLKSTQSNVVVADQIDKFQIDGRYENSTQKYKDIYVYTREIAKGRGVLMLDVCQAGAEAQGRRTVTYDMMDGSKTGKAGELDVAIGIGVNNTAVDDMVRYLTISKNKINGWKGEIPLEFNPFTNHWKDYTA
jgi:hypothetical protein